MDTIDLAGLTYEVVSCGEPVQGVAWAVLRNDMFSRAIDCPVLVAQIRHHEPVLSGLHAQPTH